MAYKRSNSQSNTKDVIQLIIIMVTGVILRVLYVFGTDVFTRQYDCGTIALDQGHTVSGGHLAYIQYLYENWHLPDFNPTTVYQFNHPPMHHFLSALIMKVCSGFVDDYPTLYETMQILPLVCSVLIMWVSYKILKMVISNDRVVNYCMIILAFHPALILLAGSINNDTLGLLFTILCVYTTMLWCEHKSYKNIIFAALSIACGMMTKQNVALMAFPMAAVFIYELFKSKGKEKLITQYLVFGIISIPLGMWFYIRNMILYKMPLVWVYTMSEDTWQYTGNVPVINRFLWPNMSELFENLKHFQIGCGYNVWIQIMRTSVLGEWDMADVSTSVKAVATLLMFVAFALAIISFITFVVVIVKRKKYHMPVTTWLMFLISYVVVFASYLKFAYDYPQQCSMHFRYIAVEMVFTIATLGMWKGNKKNGWINRLISVLTVLFCILSTGILVAWIR